MYVKRHFSPEAKEAMLDMISYLRSAFKGIIDDLDWMDEATKESARTKLDKMRQFIAYPDEMLDQDTVDSHFKVCKREKEGDRNRKRERY